MYECMCVEYKRNTFLFSVWIPITDVTCVEDQIFAREIYVRLLLFTIYQTFIVLFVKHCKVLNYFYMDQSSSAGSFYEYSSSYDEGKTTGLYQSIRMVRLCSTNNIFMDLDNIY